MPKTERPKLRLHRESVRQLTGTGSTIGGPRPVFYTFYCTGRTSDCTWLECSADTCAVA